LTHWRHAEATDTGLVRQSNQDAVYVDDSLAIVADGMGGHAAGEVASEMTIEMLRSGFVEDQTVEGLYNAINAANITVLNDARENPNHFGMGTTVIALGLTVDDEGVTSPTLCHVGDSRAYQLRDGALRQLTDDHSVAEEWVRMGRLTPEEAAVHPRRHQLTRGIGVEETIAVDVMSVHALAGDRLLLCSDGLSNELDSDTLARLSSAPFTLEEAVAQLVEAAKEAGGRDNITAVLLEFDDVSVASTPIKRTISTITPPEARAATPAAAKRRKRHHLTWRTPLALLIFLGVFVGAYFIVHWYAYSTYYLANDNGTVAVYQGQPGGVLWFKSEKIADTNYKVNTLTPDEQRRLAQTISEPTLTDALTYATTLCSTPQCQASTTPVTTTTSTTTTTLKKG
jgi:serine/threonine protein phosphatase PrpC